MMIGESYHLPSDIFSYVNRRLYGSHGEKVKVISVRDSVLIVEREDGFKFPISKEQLLANAKEPVPNEPRVIEPAETRKPKRTGSAPPVKVQGQTSLF